MFETTFGAPWPEIILTTIAAQKGQMFSDLYVVEVRNKDR